MGPMGESKKKSEKESSSAEGTAARETTQDYPILQCVSSATCA